MHSLAEAWPDPQIVPQLVALCRGVTSAFYWTSSRSGSAGVVSPGEYGGAAAFWCCRSRADCTRGKEGVDELSASSSTSRLRLAEQILKDPYNFDFLTVAEAAKEREIERGLLLHLRDPLLELGRALPSSGARCRCRSAIRTSILICSYITSGCTATS